MHTSLASLALTCIVLLAVSTATAADLPVPADLPVHRDLPDPLTLLDGAKVTTRDQWLRQRKPQLKELIQHYMYGYLAPAPNITAKITATNEKFLDGKATMKQIAIDLGYGDKCPKIEVLLVVPNKRPNDAPAPVIAGLNFNGNHTVHPDPSIHLAKGWMRNGGGVENNRATEKGRGSDASRWELENAIDQGFAIATYYYGDVLPDKNDLNDGIVPFLRKTREHGPTDMHAIAAWGWGLQRVVDYLITDKDVDASRIAVFGHSRNGKAALVAGAFDERISVVLSHQSGCGGAAPSRTTNAKAETVKRINTSFPHWFDANFKQFNDDVDKLPFDQHCLVALCAPRAVLFTNGNEDQWADPAGQHRILLAASPVYTLLGAQGMTKDDPGFGKLVGSKLGYYVDEGKHTVTKEHWNVFIRFAKQQWEVAATTGNELVIGPDYKADPDLSDRGNAKGKSFEFSMRLADSRIFPGTDKTLDPKKAVREKRKIFVYVPAAYKDGAKAPVLVTLDGPSNFKKVCNALDNLTISKDASRRLPVFIVVSVENGGNDGKGSERGLEYDTMSDRFARFINDEVFAAVLADGAIKAAFPGIAITDDPWGRAMMGCSSGGAAALTAGWFRPDLFRRLICYSGTFVDQQDDDAAEEKSLPLGAWEYHSGKKLIENTQKKPLRIFTHVSENDLRNKDAEETYHNWVMAGKRTSAALEAKGYDHRFIFSKATGHCDGKVFDQTLADTLVWVWSGYKAE